MSERTPGMWVAQQDTGAEGVLLDTWTVAAVGENGWLDYLATDLTQADAKLIAAAPDLAARLRELVVAARAAEVVLP